MDLLRLLHFIRHHPDFAPLFEQVHALCWPILIWEILWLALYIRRTGHRDVLYTVDRWGFIDLLHADDIPDPSAYRAPIRMFKPLTDASWSTDLPACLGALATLRLLPILPRITGEVSPKVTEGALPSPQPNTS